MKKKFLVSVVITTYNRTDFLSSAIESVINQTYDNIEIVVVDDNAENEKSRSTVEKIIRNYPQCVLVKNKTRMGGALARNEGIRHSHGELISFLDDDDSYFPDRIEKCVEVYEENQSLGFIYTYCQAVNVDGKVLCVYERTPEKNVLLQHLRESCLCATSQWVVPRKTFFEVGYFEDTPCKQDSIMLLKILGAQKEIACVPQILSNYMVHNLGKISGNPQRNIIGINRYRDFSRRYFHLLTREEQNIVESSFAKELILNYSLLRERKKAFVELKNFIKKKRLFKKECAKLIAMIFLGGRYFKLRTAFRRLVKKRCG